MDIRLWIKEKSSLPESLKNRFFIFYDYLAEDQKKKIEESILEQIKYENKFRKYLEKIDKIFYKYKLKIIEKAKEFDSNESESLIKDL